MRSGYAEEGLRMVGFEGIRTSRHAGLKGRVEGRKGRGSGSQGRARAMKSEPLNQAFQRGQALERLRRDESQLARVLFTW